MNSLAKTLLIVAGVIFLAIAGCTTLTIGGCATAIGVVAWQTSNLPDYATATNLSAKYKNDFDSIQQSLENEVSLKFPDQKVSLGEDILAIITEVNASDVDLYKKYDAELNGHIASNRAGTGRLIIDGNEIDCLIYIIEWNETDYYVCLKDSFKEATEAAE